MRLFQMSIAGGALIAFVTVIRVLALYRLPKTTFYVLWMIAALRLLLPLTIPLPLHIPAGIDSLSDAIPELPGEISDFSVSTQTAPSYEADITAFRPK